MSRQALTAIYLGVLSACSPAVSAPGPGAEATRVTVEPAARTAPATYDPRRITRATAILHPPGKQPVRVAVEVVREWPEIERGLKFRRHLPADSGMLFLMGEEDIHSFWMRDTYIPLDMLFIGRDMRVAGIVANTEPRTDTSRVIAIPSLYVLEVNAGWAQAHGVTDGTRVQFEGLSLRNAAQKEQ